MRKIHAGVLVLFGAALGVSVARAADPISPVIPLDPARVAQIETMVAERPAGLGPQIGNRDAWSKVAALPSAAKFLATADEYLAAPIPTQPDSLFLLYSQKGDRDQWQNVAFDRRARFNTLVFAECLRNDGRYIPKIAAYLTALCAESTWMYPAHDGDLRNFHKQSLDIDLGSSTLGFNIATAYWMLGDKLPAASRKLVEDELNRRLVEPFRQRYTGKTPLWWWMTTEMNWNSVCLAGTIGTALALVPDKHTRAEFIAAGETYSAFFLKGFPADGYCTEGLGYWNYGFGRYLMLTETIRRATGGKLDLMARPAAALPAHFGQRIQIMNDISPAFADCPLSAKPDANLTRVLNGMFQLGLPETAVPALAAKIPDIATEAIYRFDLPPARPSAAPAPYQVRDFFDTTGILIARPAKGSPCKMGVALKGGSNHESHNHNDVGSYVVLVNDKELILDPGPERYTSRTFSAKRYDSKLLNSFGHDVPLVAGQLQHEGDKTDAKVLKADFTDAADTLSLDISAAYTVKELTSLTRTWTYSRTGAGRLTVEDKAAFSVPQTFGTALITLGQWAKQADNTLLLQDGNEAVVVRIDASGPYTLEEEVIKENAAVAPTRIGINLKDKTRAAAITLTIVPR